RGDRGPERLRMGLGPRDLAGVHGRVDEVMHAVPHENLLVARPGPQRVRQDADADTALAQADEGRYRIGVEERRVLPLLVVHAVSGLVGSEPAGREDLVDPAAGVILAGPAPHL